MIRATAAAMAYSFANSSKRCSFILLLFSIVSVCVTNGIHLSHENAIKFSGDTFLVTCKDESGRPVTWSGPKGPLGRKTYPRVEIQSYGTSIYFSNVGVKEAGNYTCSAGQDKKTFHLTIKTPLTFMDTSPIQRGKENTDITLRCEVKGGDSGGDRPIVSWSLEKGELNEPKFKVMGDGLLIKNVSRADSKIYICKAMQSSTGDIREQRIQLKVEHKPVARHPVWAKGEEAWGFIGGKVNLTCEVEAEPAPTFEWSWKKQPLHDGRIYNFTHKSILEVHIKDAGVFGNYLCEAKNNLGTLDTVFVLQQGIQAIPPDFIELRGANADLLDVGIHGPKNVEKVPSSMNPIGYQVQYKLKEEKHWKHIDFPIAEDNSYPLQHLEHNSEYDVRAATRNRAGLSAFTNASRFRTLPLETDDAAAALLVSSPTWTVFLIITQLVLTTFC